MKISRPSPESLRLSGLPDWLAELIRQIPDAGDASDPAAASRIFPTPSKDPEVAADWARYVTPDLEAHLDRVRSSVNDCLANLRQKKGNSFELTLQLDELEDWILALNQARLSLAARHGFSEEELSRAAEPDPDDPRSLVRFQMDFYAMLQEVFLDVVDGREPD